MVETTPIMILHIFLLLVEVLVITVKSCVKVYEDEINVMSGMNVDVDLSSMNRDITDWFSVDLDVA